MRALADAYIASHYKILGHGKRAVGVLADAICQYDHDASSDIYGHGPIIESFEQEMAELLGMEGAVFFPSGTMAQQIALRIWSDEKKIHRVAYHPLSHLEIHEQDGLKELHHIETVLLGEKDRLFTLDDLKAVDQDISTLLIELPQREIGGLLPSYEELLEISTYCQANNIRLHLDGARLLESIPYYKKDIKEIASLFDSIYISFYKGIGGVAGAILAGPKAFLETSKIWKRRHGGDLISLYPYIISAKHYYNQRKDKMATYAEWARDLAVRFNAIEGVYTIPKVPVTNMFHVHYGYKLETVKAALIHTAKTSDVGLGAGIIELNDVICKYEVSIGDHYGRIPEAVLESAFQCLKEQLAG